MPLGADDWAFTADGEYSPDIPVADDDVNIEAKNFADPKWR